MSDSNNRSSPTIAGAIHGKFALRRIPIELYDTNDKSPAKLLIYTKRGKFLGYGLSCVLFVLTGFWMMIDQIGNGQFGMALVGLLCIVLFGFGVFFFWVRFSDDEPALVFDREGILDKTNLAGGVRVLWQEIETISLLQKEYLRALPHDPDAMIAMRDAEDRSVVQQNLQFYGSPINVAIQELHCTVEQINEAIQYYGGYAPPDAQL